MTASNDGAASYRRGWRRGAGAMAGLLLVAGAIALGVVYSNKGHQAGSPAKILDDAVAAGETGMDKVLDAINNMGGGDKPSADATAPAAEAVTPVTPVASTDADKAATPAATAPGPQGIIQTLSADVAQNLGMRVCTPVDGTELVRDACRAVCS